MWVEFVVGSLPFTRMFSLDSPVFLSPEKLGTSKLRNKATNLKFFGNSVHPQTRPE